MFLSFLLPAALVFSSSSLSFVSSSAIPHDGHEHRATQRLPADEWYQPSDHPVHKLFRRDTAGADGVTYPDVGSPTWAAAYPKGAPDTSQLPAAWTNALNNAIAAGKIPDIPQSSNIPQTNPVYPPGHDPHGPEICSATYKCRMPGDVWDAPDGFIGTGFDDGPTDASPALLDFLEANNEITTHFVIGSYIMYYPQTFTRYVELGHDIAVHTWTHPYMTTLSNLDVLAQLAWSMEIIHNSTGGRLPRFWRPPYGDTDMRVRAIAKEVLNLDCIIWNQDTEDWSLTVANGATPKGINASMTTWLTGAKSPGLIILEHELSKQSVQAFEDAYPVMKANNWKTMSVAQLVASVDGGDPYQNAESINSGSVDAAPLIAANMTMAPTSAASTSTADSSSSSSSTSTLETVSPRPSGNEASSPNPPSQPNSASAPLLGLLTAGASTMASVGLAALFTLV